MKLSATKYLWLMKSKEPPPKTLEIQVGGGILSLWNPDGRGGQRSSEIQVGGGGGVKNVAIRGEWAGFFLE